MTAAKVSHFSAPILQKQIYMDHHDEYDVKSSLKKADIDINLIIIRDVIKSWMVPGLLAQLM